MCQDNIFEKTYAELVEELGDYCCQNVDFFLEGCDSIRSIYMNEDDARVFFGCMNIYDVYGVNYFHYYLALKRDAYGDFSHGIVRGIGSNHSHFQMDSSEYQLKELIDVLRFFSISEYQGVPYEEFEAAYSNAFALCMDAERERKKQSAIVKQKQRERLCNNYFNYDNFSEAAYNKELQSVLEQCQRQKKTLNEALEMTQACPSQSYIVVFMQDDQVVSISQASLLFACIERKSGTGNINHVYFKPVSSKYIDDIVLDLYLHYGLPIPRTYPCYRNQKYATVKNAVSAYTEKYNISKKALMYAIKMYNVQLIKVEFNRLLINKKELYRAINGTYKVDTKL